MDRRRFLGTTGAALGGLLAGCSGSATNAVTTTESSTTQAQTTTSQTTEDASYTVSMEPMGEVTFQQPPEKWVSYMSTYGDMAISLGQADGLAGMYFKSNYPTQFYDDLGIEVDLSSAPALNADGVNKEAFYVADADVHLMDPNMLTAWFDWSDSDVSEIRENVGPFVGNMIRRRGDKWHDYTYYTLYEAFEKVAQVFQEQERYDQWTGVHDEVVASVEQNLPAESERPEIALLSVNSDFEKGAFWGYTLDDSAGKKQYRDLGATDAFASLDQKGSFKIDYEGLLEVDPDILVFHFGVSHSTEEQFAAKMDKMRDDPVGSELTAVKEDRLFRGGTPYQGPIINLYQTELAAQQFYPDTFTDPLFDRERVRNIVTGK